jgi:hypothetical protein
VDATFAAFGIDAVYTPAGGEPLPVRVIARRSDAIVGFGETRTHAETAIRSCGGARSPARVPANLMGRTVKGGPGMDKVSVREPLV